MSLRRPAIAALALACALPALAGADRRGGAAASAERFTLRITAGDASNEIGVRVSADGSQYVITANGAIPPAAGCRNPPGEPTELRCTRATVAGIAIDANGGNDTISTARGVTAYMLLSGGAGFDDLIGGSNADEIRGGPGPDRLVGRDGPDQLFGEGGDDELRGGPGKDILRGGAGTDSVLGGPGRDDQRD
jgi:hypothetical protein